MLKPNSVIGILGGGQLGRMTTQAAANLGYKVHVYTPDADSPTEHICYKTTNAEYLNEESLKKFASEVELVSFEFENIPYRTLEILEQHVPVFPSSKVIKICQNRIREKDFLNSLGVKTAPYKGVYNLDELEAAVDIIGRPCVLKTTEMGYDGKGQVKIEADTNLADIWFDCEGIVEGFVNFQKEISVIVARNESGDVECFDPVENIHKNHILDTTIAPAQISGKVAEKAREIAKTIASELGLIGVLAVEMFVVGDELLVNELAPRPHNSGHHTIDSCITSQFEQFVRAICGLPLGSPKQHTKAEMKNLVGSEIDGFQEFAKQPNVKLHHYGKSTSREGRKMGHITKLLD